MILSPHKIQTVFSKYHTLCRLGLQLRSTLASLFYYYFIFLSKYIFFIQRNLLAFSRKKIMDTIGQGASDENNILAMRCDENWKIDHPVCYLFPLHKCKLIKNYFSFYMLYEIINLKWIEKLAKQIYHAFYILQRLN